jgi:hypothetical protein
MRVDFFEMANKTNSTLATLRGKQKIQISKIVYVKWIIKTDTTGMKRISRCYSDQLCANK